jgi:hypothetical protein
MIPDQREFSLSHAGAEGSLENFAQKRAGLGVDAWRLAFARAGDAQAKAVLSLAEKGMCPHLNAACIQIEHDMRLAETSGKIARGFGPFRHTYSGAIDQDHEPVGVAHVPFGPLSRFGERRLAQSGV